MKPLLLCLVATLVGCSTVTIQKGDWQFRRTSLGTDLALGPFLVEQNGPNSFKVSAEAIKSEQAQALGTVAEGVARGLAGAAK